jgi:hypothetical protein
MKTNRAALASSLTRARTTAFDKHGLGDSYRAMIKTAITVVGGFLWAGVAITNSTPANAKAQTYQNGAFAIAHRVYEASPSETCNGPFAYLQNIKFVNASCNSGECDPNILGNYALVDAVYPEGRHKVQSMENCSEENLYELGLCAC